ncbi:MAG: hypothetical protein DI605_19900 [Sphingomonas sp.]|nr:MAG: hypothetical protein DI605_19900 [Sphingomonas sp.]
MPPAPAGGARAARAARLPDHAAPAATDQDHAMPFLDRAAHRAHPSANIARLTIGRPLYAR